MADPLVTRVVGTVRGRPRWSPDASRMVADEGRVLATVTRPGSPARPGALPAPLPALAETDGPAGPGLTLALGYGLGAVTRWTGRPRSTPCSSWPAATAGRACPRRRARGPGIPGSGPGRPGRPGAARRRPLGAPAEVWEITSAAIPGLVPPAVPRPPRGVPDLLALAAEVAGDLGGRRPIPELSAITGRGGSGRLVTEARRLRQLLAD